MPLESREGVRGRAGHPMKPRSLRSSVLSPVAAVPLLGSEARLNRANRLLRLASKRSATTQALAIYTQSLCILSCELLESSIDPPTSRGKNRGVLIGSKDRAVLYFQGSDNPITMHAMSNCIEQPIIDFRNIVFDSLESKAIWQVGSSTDRAFPWTNKKVCFLPRQSSLAYVWIGYQVIRRDCPALFFCFNQYFKIHNVHNLNRAH